METEQMISSKTSVLAFINALNSDNFKEARKYTTDNLKFVGVMGARDGADVYFSDMEKMRLKYKILKAFEDGDDVCLLYDIDMSGKTIFSSGWYHLKNGKIESIKVVFDPRPLLDK